MASSVEIRTRTKRQSSWTMVSSPCLTGRGTLGKCMSFRLCYPYIKLPDLQYWDSWVLGMYDTCSYINHDHKQVGYANKITSNEKTILVSRKNIQLKKKNNYQTKTSVVTTRRIKGDIAFLDVIFKVVGESVSLRRDPLME